MSASIPNRILNTPKQRGEELIALIPDFPFNYGNFLNDAKASSKQPFQVPQENQGKRVAIVGGGISGMVAAYELMRAGLKPVVLESSGRIGGRMYSEQLPSSGIAELGSMRFPPTCKALFHYFDKVGMTSSMVDFPNPATTAAPGTVVDFKGKQDYFDLKNPEYPMPAKYLELAEKWDTLLNKSPLSFKAMQEYMANPTPENLQLIKQIWNSLLLGDWDNNSFHSVLVDDGWDPATIELFGQVGFGSGGWNTDYVNSFLEVLRVSYAAMDSDHQLTYQGADHLPNTLWHSSPDQLEDTAVNPGDTVEALTRQALNGLGITTNLLGNEVRGIRYNPAPADNYTLFFNNDGKDYELTVEAIVYTPHVRVLDMISSTYPDLYPGTRALLDEETWEAIEYTHYMQSSKVFVKANSPFWEQLDADEKHLMSMTLSDRLTRGTYLLNYQGNAVICLSYTWNDDSMKFIPYDLPERITQTLSVLQDIYPELEFGQLTDSSASTTISWETERNFIGAFKNNLPGQYAYQRKLFSQFAEPTTAAEAKFVLAGDDISWTAGWVEGAIATALNAANRITVSFGGSANNDAGPLDSWETLKPLAL